MGKALIFFAFANNPRNTYLSFLKEEERGISRIMLPQKFDLGLLDFIYPMQTTSDDLYDHLIKIGNKLSILHYSGHASSLHLELVDANYKMEQFCKLVGGLNQLKLVFLNGCSTKGMVEFLLDAGVKAVIATSEKIGDLSASQFSQAFYYAFTQKGKTLQKAFNEALSKLSDPPEEGKQFVSRGSMGRMAGLAPTDPVPWALYYREEEKSVLDWTLINEDANADFEGQLNQHIQRLREKITEEENKITLVLEACKGFEDALKQLGDNPAAVFIRAQLEEKQKLYATHKQELDQVFLALRSAINDHEKIHLKERLAEALRKLNYNIQIDHFEQALAGRKGLGAFIVQGSPLCGQDILKDRLLDLAGIRYEYKEVLIDFAAQSFQVPTIENIWQRIGEQLPKVLGRTPEEIIQSLYEHYFSTGQEVMLIFNNIHITTSELNIRLIKEFWFRFVELLKLLILPSDSSGKVFLFVLDKNCKIIHEEGKFISHKEKFYREAFDQQQLNSHFTYIFPIVERVRAAYLNEWRRAQSLPLDLGLTPETLNELIDEHGAFILPTIKSICRKADFENIYYENFQQYEYKIPRL